MQIITKISAATVFGAIPTKLVEGLDPSTGKPVSVKRAEKMLIFRVLGTIKKAAVKVTNLGESMEFTGAFEATNLHTGEVFRSGKCFLPPTATEITAAAFAAAGTDIQVAFDVGVAPANNAYGYQYTVTPLLQENEATDPLTLLKNSLPPLPALLSAPEATYVPATEAETAQDVTTEPETTYKSKKSK